MQADPKLHLERLRDLIRRGLSLRAARKEVGLRAQTCQRLLTTYCPKLLRRKPAPPLSDEERRRIRELLEKNLASLREIARLVHRSPRTVMRERDRLYGQASDVEREQAYQRRRRNYRCDACGYTINLVPCPVCAARASRQAS